MTLFLFGHHLSFWNSKTGGMIMNLLRGTLKRVTCVIFCLIFLMSFTSVMGQTVSLSGKPGLQAARGYSPDRLYVPLVDANRIAVVDLWTMQQTHTITGTDGEPIGIDTGWRSFGQDVIVVTNRSAQTIQMFDLDTETEIDSYDFSFITDHEPGEVAYLSSDKIVFGYQNNGSGGLSTKRISAWDPSEGTFSTFGYALQEPHYIARSGYRGKFVALESNENPAMGVAYDNQLNQIATNTNIPTDYSGTVPPSPGYNITSLNNSGDRIFAGKNIYDQNFQLITSLPEYSEPIFLSDGTIVALSGDTGANFTTYTRMDPETGEILTTGPLPTPVSDMPDVFLVLTGVPPIPIGGKKEVIYPDENQVCAVDRANNQIVFFKVEVFPFTSVSIPWDMLE